MFRSRTIGNMTISMRRIAAASATVCMMTMSLSACTPPGKAVGDTQERQPDVAFDGLDRGDVVIGFIGSDQPDFDAVVLQAFDKAGLRTSYVSIENVDNPIDAAQQGVRDMASRQVAIILISRIDATTQAAGWDEALGDVRESGIPVALLNALALPDDDTLYAAALTINDRAATSSGIDDAVMTIIDDLPHDKDMMVTTLIDDGQ